MKTIREIIESGEHLELADWVFTRCGLPGEPDANDEPGLCSGVVDGRLRIRITGYIGRRRTWDSIENDWATGTEIAALIESGASNPSIKSVELHVEESRSSLLHAYFPVRDAIQKCRRVGKVVRAFVWGDCLGAAFLMALSANRIVAGPRARFGALQLHDDVSALYMVSHFGTLVADDLAELRPHVPASIREEILAGKILNAEQAQRAGLIHRIIRSVPQ